MIPPGGADNIGSVIIASSSLTSSVVAISSACFMPGDTVGIGEGGHFWFMIVASFWLATRSGCVDRANWEPPLAISVIEDFYVDTIVWACPHRVTFIPNIIDLTIW